MKNKPSRFWPARLQSSLPSHLFLRGLLPPSLRVTPARRSGVRSRGLWSRGLWSRGLRRAGAFLRQPGPPSSPSRAFPQGTPAMARILFSSVRDHTELFMKKVLPLEEPSLFTKARRKMSKYKYYHKPSRFLRMFL